MTHEGFYIIHAMWFRRWLCRANPTNDERMVLQVEEQPFHPYVGSKIVVNYFLSKEFEENLLEDVEKTANELIDSSPGITHDFDDKDLLFFAKDALKLVVLFKRRCV